ITKTVGIERWSVNLELAAADDRPNALSDQSVRVIQRQDDELFVGRGNIEGPICHAGVAYERFDSMNARCLRSGGTGSQDQDIERFVRRGSAVANNGIKRANADKLRRLITGRIQLRPDYGCNVERFFQSADER